MVYSGDLKSPVERHAGSSPASRTKSNWRGPIMVLEQIANLSVAYAASEFESRSLRQF